MEELANSMEAPALILAASYAFAIVAGMILAVIITVAIMRDIRKAKDEGPTNPI